MSKRREDETQSAVSQKKLRTESPPPTQIRVIDDTIDDSSSDETTDDCPYSQYRFGYLMAKNDPIGLDPDDDQEPLEWARYKSPCNNRNLFSAYLYSYKNGARVFKQCAPWGKDAALFNRGFQIVDKTFVHPSRPPTSIRIRARDNDQEYVLTPGFYQGWTDDVAEQRFLDYRK